MFDNFKDNLSQNLADAESAALLVRDIEFLIDLNGGPDRLIIVVAPHDSALIGKTLADVCAADGKTAVQALIDFAMQGNDQLRAGVLFRPMASHAFDVENYMRQEYTATCTDAGVLSSDRPGLHPVISAPSRARLPSMSRILV